MALPGVVVHRVEGDTTGLYGPLALVTCGIVEVFGQILPAVDCSVRDLDGGPKPSNSGISTDVFLFSELGHALIHHNRVFRGVSRVQDMTAGVLSPVAVSDQAPGAIIYDCRPPILPVTVRLQGLRGPCVIHSTASSSMAAPPEGEDSVAGASVPGLAAAPEIRSVLSDSDLEDELCHFSPLQETISPLPESGDDVPMSPSRYLAPPVPDTDISVSETRVSPS